MSEHTHKWESSNFVIDTFSPTYTWWCECGYSSHDGGKTIDDCCGRGAKEKLAKARTAPTTEGRK